MNASDKKPSYVPAGGNQTNLFGSETPQTGRRPFSEIVRVMVPRAISDSSGCYDYGIPEGMQVVPGDFVVIPLARKTLTGIVWAQPRPWTQDDPPQRKLRAIVQVHDMPPLAACLRDFIDWMAQYTMSPPGQVVRMFVPAKEAFDHDKPVQGYMLGNEKPARMTPARNRVLAVLAEAGPETVMAAGALADAAGVSSSVIHNLAAAGGLEKRPLLQAAEGQPDPDFLKVDFSPEQAAAAAALTAAVTSKKFSPCLLDGVTGSGKTEVYFEAIAEALRQNLQSLIILPEISLTAQFLKRFEARFGCEPALWHSGLTSAQRRRSWRAVAQGQARVLVGARSALFMPWQDLGLIVVDEEHDAGFKQEDGVIYNARDMAVVCARFSAATVILSSATPALETVINAEEGRYDRLKLPNRHGQGQLPDIRLVDLRVAPPPRGQWLSPVVVEAVKETLDKGEQALLFMNRRGYAPLTLCRSCGHRYACPDCDSWLVEHRFKRILACHQCGHERPLPMQCDACEETDHLAACGPGVERITEEVAGLFPDKRVTVLSSDLISGEEALREALHRITAGETDIIVGTQIIAKGHHFPKLGFVGVVDADLGMGTGDLRAGERTYQMLSQVTGRAGRELTDGQAMLQSYAPDHPVLQALAEGNRDAFLEREADMRRLAAMPPYGRLAGIILSGPDMRSLNGFARSLAQKAPLSETIRVLGPAPAPIARIRGQHRLRFLVHGRDRGGMQDFIKDWLAQVPKRASIRCTVDIDPYSFF
ncbi:MAG: primosomal protein N' [Parvibaculales bacterium]